MSARLDAELVARGLAASRERAKEYIQAGMVTVNGEAVDKPSCAVYDEDKLEIIGETLKYVGRGGLKLEGAVKAFGLSFDGKTCLDIGASTGGFTDCMLQNGAKKVYAADVGHGQIAEKLMADPRVKSLEGVNVKDLTPDFFKEQIDIVTADLSFISVRFAAAASAAILEDGGEAVFLIKPQFEAGRQHIANGGIVKDKKAHIEVLRALCESFAELKFEVKNIVPSPIRGGDGNIEYLAYLVKRNSFTPKIIDCKAVCELAFRSLKG